MKKKKSDIENTAQTESCNCVRDVCEESSQSCECEASRAASDMCNEERILNSSEVFKLLDEATAEAAKNRDLYMRAVADLDTYRRKVRREKEELEKYALQVFIETLIPSLDNLDIAMKAMMDSGEAAAWAEGIEMVRRQMTKTFEEFGVKEIGEEGKVFDPNLEECVSHQPSDEVPENDVISVQRKGYTINGRLVRPASVVVSSGAAKQEA